MYEAISRNKRRSWFIIFLFIVLLVGIGYALGEISGIGWGGPAVALAAAVVMSFSGYYYSDRVVLAVSRAREAQKTEFPYLFNTVEGLALAAGVPMPGLYVIEDTAPNAFATGRDPNHSAIAVTTGLLSKLDRVQLEGVIAHEMSHIQNYDIRLASLAVVFVGAVVLLSDWTMRTLWWGGRGRRKQNRGTAGTILLLIGLVFAVIGPIAAQLLRLAVSRKREFLADASAAMLTRYPEGLASALEKLAADPEPLEAANRATAHLYIVNPVHSHAVNNLLSTHPPIEERIAALRSM